MVFVLFGCVLVKSKVTREFEAAQGREKLKRVATKDVVSKFDGSLRPIGEFYGTDKVHSGFVDVYNKVLPHGEDRGHVQFVLEIGVFFGASIKMWRDFYPNATIIGIDAFKGIEGYKFAGSHQRFSQPRAFLDEWRAGKQGERIELVEADESDDGAMIIATCRVRALLETSRGTGGGERLGLDVVIDDGSHLQRNQQANLGRLFPLVSPGGFYVIEDMHASLITGYDVPPDSPATTFALLERFNQSGRIEGSFKQALPPHEAHYIERWSEPPACYVPPGKKRDRAFTCVLRKRTSAPRNFAAPSSE